MSKEFTKSPERQEIITPEQFSEECLKLFEQRFNAWQRFKKQIYDGVIRERSKIPGILRPIFNQKGELHSLECMLDDSWFMKSFIRERESRWVRVHGDIDEYFTEWMERCLGTRDVYRINNFGFQHPYFTQKVRRWLNTDISPTREDANIYDWQDLAPERVAKLLLSVKDKVIEFKERYKIGVIYAMQRVLGI
jgi:hypothetical protein